MTLRMVVVSVACLAAFAAASGHVQAVGSDAQASRASLPQASDVGSAGSARVLLDTYCVTCHNQGMNTAGLTLDTMDVTNVSAAAAAWEKVVRKLRAGVMPPASRPGPGGSSRDAFVSWLEMELDRAAEITPNPGRTETFHRLNRVEYRNAIRDLLAVDIDVSSLLPADDASYGFDNIAGVLKLSQSLLERYLSAARTISRAAVGSPPPAPLSHTFTLARDLPQYGRMEGLPFGTRGGILVPYSFPQDGEYLITVQPQCDKTTSSAGCDGTTGFVDQHHLEISVGGERVKLFPLEPKPRGGGYGGGGSLDDLRFRFQVRIPVRAGVRDVGVTFLKLPSIEEFDGLRARFITPYHRNYMVPRYAAIYQPYVGSVTIDGPFEPTGAGDTLSRRMIFTCHPAESSDEGCAQDILARLTRRAFRRPVTEGDLAPLLALYRDTQAEGGFEAGLERSIQALLVRPEFLFRVEHDGVATPNTNYRISDVELASRLSFFLWSSIPDAELLDLASRDELHDPGVLAQQVRRMLADSRSQALAENFAGQWLQLRNVEYVRPSEPLFPNFDASLRQAFRRETELFFDSILREGRSVVEMLTADYTFANERLARHYGIPHVTGSHFRRVALPANRRGLLGHGSILTVTSNPVRTSPVSRGTWILENILGTRPPDPPPDAPELEEKQGSGTVRSMRERMAEHRRNPTCASCHAMIDPLGFALENYDPVGRWRDADESGTRVDASGSLPDGISFDGVAQFRDAVVTQPERFVATVTEKLLTYALGRGLEHYDMPAVRSIVRDAAHSDYRFASVVTGIVKSLPFQMRRSQS